MTYSNTKPSEKPCQPLSDNQFNFNAEDHLLNDCRAYCTAIIQLPDSPWRGYANLMGYWYSKRQTKISKLQRNLLHYLHQWYFSKGNPAYLKIKNLSKKLKVSRRSTIRAITRLVERGILIRLEYWSEKYKRFRSVILPQIYMTLKEKLVFQLEKRSLLNTETVTGGSDRYFSNLLKILKIKNCNIYTNILSNNVLLTNTPSKDLTSLNQHAPQNSEHDKCLSKPFATRGTNNMQTKTKPKRLLLKVKTSCPSNIAQTIGFLKEKNFNPDSVPYSALSELFYYLEGKLFYGHGANNPDVAPLDLNRLFRFSIPNKNQFIDKYDRKLFKILMELYTEHSEFFQDPDIAKMTMKLIGYWSACAKNSNDKNRKFVAHNANLKTKAGFKIYVCIMYHLAKDLCYSRQFKTALPTYEAQFVRAIKRYVNYAYVLNLPKKIDFDVALVDHANKKKFFKCLVLNDDEFYDMMNTNKKVYQASPENQKSLTNFKQIFIDSYYSKDASTGKERFEQYRPSFSRFLETLITRIEKYSSNGKRVELCDLKLTAETKQDIPVLHYYMEWLKTNIFAETYFKFDEMFSLGNWNMFIKNFMRIERGYSDYWKILDKN